MTDSTKDDDGSDQDKHVERTTTGSIKKKIKPVIVHPEVPSAIKPQSPAYIVDNPVENQGNPVEVKTTTVTGTIVKSTLHPKIPEAILPKGTTGTNTQSTNSTPPPVERPATFSAQTTIGQAPASGSVPPRAPTQSSSTNSSASKEALPPSQNPPSSGGAGVSIFFSLLALCGVAVSVYYVYSSQQQLSQLQTQNNDDKNSIQSLLSQTQTTLTQIQGIQQNNAQENKTLQTLKSELTSSWQRMAELNKDSVWVISEVSYLIFMANERLQIAKDVPTAIAQLEQAQQRLQALNDPALQAIKESISKDIAKLRLQPVIDRQAIWTQLQTISLAIPTLEFKNLANEASANLWMAEKTLPANTPTWKKALWRSWYEIKGLIRVTKEESNPVVPPMNYLQKAQILHSMQLMVEQAQWAALQGDSQIFASNLKTLNDSVNRYLAPSAEKQQIQTQISTLAQTSVAVPELKITESLEALSKAKNQSQAPTPVRGEQP